MVHFVETVGALDAWLTSVRASAASVGLVPTMGVLHAGHEALIEQARRDCEHVVVSIFVNPLQFDREDDLRRYPRLIEADLETCRRVSVDTAFVPSQTEMYPNKPTTRISVGPLGDHLCGAHRQGHFEGVATVVAKLFNIVRPQRAYFGEKDAQQLAIIRRMTADLSVPILIIGVPTVREADGLALSSRNRHLSLGERQQASALFRALEEARRLIEGGTVEAGSVVRQALEQIPREVGLRVEYLEVVDPDELQPVERIGGPVLVAGALWVGDTKLIDNVVCEPTGQQS